MKRYETEEQFIDEFTTLIARDMAHACLYTGEGQNVMYYVRWSPINPVQLEKIYPNIHDLFEKDKEEFWALGHDKERIYTYQMKRWNLLEDAFLYEIITKKYRDCIEKIKTFIDSHFEIEDQVYVSPKDSIDEFLKERNGE